MLKSALWRGGRHVWRMPRLPFSPTTSFADGTGGRVLPEAIQQLTKKYGAHAISYAGHNVALPIEVIPTGSLGLDFALGVGGLPKGRLTEIFGPEASGKTTLALHCIAEAQKLGGRCVLVDVEHALDPSLAAACGVKVEDLIVCKPMGGEEALEAVKTFVHSRHVAVVVLDSVAALLPKSELEGDMGDPHMAQQARLMGQALRKLTPANSGTVLIFINQVIGNRVRVKLVKCKISAPYTETEFDIDVGRGISRESELIDFGLKHGLVTKIGNWHAYKGENFANGREKAKAYLRENKKMADELYVELRTLMFEKKDKDELGIEPEATEENVDEEVEDGDIESTR